MECVICGKTSRIIPISIVKYSQTHNTLAEVLSSILGTKISNLDFVSSDNQICYSCNRHCEQYDRLNQQLLEVKQHILQEYARRLCDGQRNAGTVPCKKIKLQAHSDQETLDDDEVEELIDPASPITIVSDDEAEAPEQLPEEKFFGQHVPIKEDPDEKIKECSVLMDRLPDSITESIKSKTYISRLYDKKKLTRLPDYEYEEWFELDGYCFTLYTQNARGRLLKCHVKGCVACVRVTNDAAVVRLTSEHTHEPDTKILERNHLYGSLKQRTMTEADTPLETIYKEEGEKYPGGASILPIPLDKMREWRASKDDTVVLNDDLLVPTEEEQGAHRCEICNIGFFTSKLLNAHMKEHEKKLKRCRFCMKPFVNQQKLIEHQRTHEIKAALKLSTPKRSAKKKPKNLLNNENKSPLVNVQREKLECLMCSGMFDSLTELKQHLETEHEDINMCPECEIAFKTKTLLEQHIKDVHGKRKKRPKKIFDPSQRDNMEDELSKITGQGSDDDALADETGGDDPIDPDWETNNVDDETSGMEKCYYCDISFFRKSSLTKHLHKEHNQGYKCKYCDENFRVKSDLHTHQGPCGVEWRLKQRDKYKCEVCHKPHANEDRLQDHLYTHCTKYKWECSICSANFHKKATLITHMISQDHKGQIRINPPILNSTVLPSVYYHEESEPVISEAVVKGKRYECAVCRKICNNKQQLFYHMKTEGHISDSIIELQVAKPKVFKEEPDDWSTKLEFAHTGTGCETTGPFVVGGIRFLRKEQALKMWYKMNRKKPFECAVCGDGFYTKSQLFHHMESKNHITDSIVENIPVLDEVKDDKDSSVNNHQTDTEKETPRVKQEQRRIEILSQVIIPPGNEASKQPDQENQFSTYVTENEDGETILVLPGDIAETLGENTRLYMDEEGNIVTQDADGNTIQVMQVDMIRAQQTRAQEVHQLAEQTVFEIHQPEELNHGEAKEVEEIHAEVEEIQEEPEEILGDVNESQREVEGNQGEVEKRQGNDVKNIIVMPEIEEDISGASMPDI